MIEVYFAQIEAILRNFPAEIVASQEPTLEQVLLEITQLQMR